MVNYIGTRCLHQIDPMKLKLNAEKKEIMQAIDFVQRIVCIHKVKCIKQAYAIKQCFPQIQSDNLIERHVKECGLLCWPVNFSHTIWNLEVIILEIMHMEITNRWKDSTATVSRTHVYSMLTFPEAFGLAKLAWSSTYHFSNYDRSFQQPFNQFPLWFYRIWSKARFCSRIQVYRAMLPYSLWIYFNSFLVEKNNNEKKISH